MLQVVKGEAQPSKWQPISFSGLNMEISISFSTVFVKIELIAL